MKALIYRIVGPPPGKDASRAERLRWIRRLNLRCQTPLTAAVLILGLLWVWPWWVVVIGTAWQAYTLISISLKIRRAEHTQ